MNNHEKKALIALAENIISYSHAQPGLQELARIAMEQLNPKPAPETGWTGNSAADAALIMLDRINTTDYGDDDRIEGVKRVIRRMAVSPAPLVVQVDEDGNPTGFISWYERKFSGQAYRGSSHVSDCADAYRAGIRAAGGSVAE